jgi:hypothetical protein
MRIGLATSSASRCRCIDVVDDGTKKNEVDPMRGRGVRVLRSWWMMVDEAERQG